MEKKNNARAMGNIISMRPARWLRLAKVPVAEVPVAAFDRKQHVAALRGAELDQPQDGLEDGDREQELDEREQRGRFEVSHTDEDGNREQQRQASGGGGAWDDGEGRPVSADECRQLGRKLGG